MGFPGSYSMCRMQRLSLPDGLMFTLTIIARISFQRSANGFRNLSEKQRQMMFFDFQGQKVLPRCRIWGSSDLLHKLKVFSRFPRSSRAFWVLVGPKWTPNDKVRTVLVNIGPLYGSPWKNFISSWRVLVRHPKILCPYARNALLLLAVTHIRYGMPHGKNKENKACSRLIFFNLQPNGIPRIIEHVQNETLVLTRRTSVYTHHDLSDFIPKECQWV